MRTFYLDHAATTPMHPQVVEVMMDILQGQPGNASSIHAYGRAARQRLNKARDLTAEVIGCKPSELVFTSGGTESDNAALMGGAAAMRKRGRNHIITSAVEHHAVLHACEALAERGFDVTVLPVDQEGKIRIDDLQQALRPETGLVSIMWGNNEVGTLQPVEQIGELVHSHGALYHIDAVQALGAVPIRLSELAADFVSFSAHKINGPHGTGALYIAAGTPFEPSVFGGAQERKRRAGTENIAGIAGFAEAVRISASDLHNKALDTAALRDRFEQLIQEALGEDRAVVNGSLDSRLPHITNISLIGTDTETMLMNLDMEGIAAASGSACTSGSLERSHVLKAMGLPEQRLMSAVRFSFGLGNTMEEVETAAGKIATVVKRIRSNT
ncbi:cysteine desulfurase NifS [Paenibacillus sambharensis]|uniref:Cysteine desulfurase NifS n=1 Tax=Paenibacillus sambharensis TaxID=1803190 RepID=A0A2W1LS07_9BACL|nr:cysteine desulfurase family protein [Paenibacillus sambharensis]PZD94237.1 cysteine desulfurase NifS [Paenibacillus sambharensis]